MLYKCSLNHRNLKFCPKTIYNVNIQYTPIYYKNTQGMKRLFPCQTESTSKTSKNQRLETINEVISMNNTKMILIPSITF